MPTEVSKPTPTAEPPREVVWPEWVYPYPAGLAGGLLGGAVVGAVGVSYGLISCIGVLHLNCVGPWLPVNLVAATVLRDMQTMPLDALKQFNALWLVLGLVIHIAMSIGLGEMFSFILPALPGRPLYWGPVIGPMLWVGAFVGALPIINEVMYKNVEIVSFALGNVLYGLVLGWWIDRTPMIHVDA